jgi:hypothetical protein
MKFIGRSLPLFKSMAVRDAVPNLTSGRTRVNTDRLGGDVRPLDDDDAK